MTIDFTGFSAAGIEFLTELGTQDKAWFDEHRSTYQAEVVAPTKAFVTALGAAIATDFAPAIEAQPKTNGSISPINNDRRFSPEKSPYKDHLLLKFWEGPEKKTATQLMVRISAEMVGFSNGAPILDAEHYRSLVDDDTTGAELVAILDRLAQDHDIGVGDDHLKRVPKPYDADHPRAELLRRRGVVYVRWPEPTPASIHGPEFVDFCAERLAECADLHRWLVTHMS